MFNDRKKVLRARIVLGALAAGVSMQAALANAAAADTTRVIVGFKKGAIAVGKAAITAAGGKEMLDLAVIDATAVDIPNKALAGLRNNPHIEFVETDSKRFPSGLASSSTGTPYQLGQQIPYGIAMVQADQL